MTIYLYPFPGHSSDPGWKERYRTLIGGNYSPPIPTEAGWTHQTWTLDAGLNPTPDDPSTYPSGGWDSEPVDARLSNYMYRLTLNRNSKSCGGSYRATRKFPEFAFLDYTLRELPPGVSYKLVKKYSFDEGKWVYEKVPLRTRRIRRKAKKPQGQLDICPLNFNETIFSGFGGSTLRTGIPTLIQDPNAPPGNFITRDLDSWSYTSPCWVRYSYSLSPDSFILRDAWADLPDLCDSSNLVIDYSSLVAENDLIAVRRLYSKVKDQKVDLATGLAEGAQTIRLLADIVVRLAKAYASLKKFKLSEAVKQILPTSRKEVANDFLAYRYGISPLVSDLQGAAEQLADWVAGEPKFGAKVKSKSSYKLDPTITTFFGITKRVDIEVEVTVRYKIVYKVDNTVMKNLDKLGFTNPANVEWELVPFSFVVDWFLPIGNFLRDLEALSFLKVQEVSKTTFIRESISVSMEAPAGAMLLEGKVLDNWNGGCGIVNTQCVREIVPTPTLPLPSFKNPLSTGHIANAVALFLQILK